MINSVGEIKPPADRRRAQWKVLTHRARLGKNAEAFLNLLIHDIFTGRLRL